MDDKQFYQSLAATNTPPIAPERLESMASIALSQPQAKQHSLAKPNILHTLWKPAALVLSLAIIALSLGFSADIGSLPMQPQDPLALEEINDYMTYSLLDDLS